MAMEKEYKNPLSERLHPAILGSQEFIKEIKASFLSDIKPDRELPDLNDVPERIGLAEIDKAVEVVMNTDKKFARQVKLYFSHHYTGLKLREIGNWFGISESGVTQASHRVGLQVEKDKRVSKMIKKIARIVNV